MSSCWVGPHLSEKLWGRGDWGIFRLSLLQLIIHHYYYQAIKHVFHAVWGSPVSVQWEGCVRNPDALTRLLYVSGPLPSCSLGFYTFICITLLNACCVSSTEYFFDVTWVGFNSILGVYRSGNLHLANGVCALVTRDNWTFDPSSCGWFWPEVRKKPYIRELFMLPPGKQKCASDDKIEYHGSMARCVQQGWTRLLGHRRIAPRTVLRPQILSRDWALLQGSFGKAASSTFQREIRNMHCISHHKERADSFSVALSYQAPLHS